MKTKITLLIVTICLVGTSCIKDFYGHPDDKNGILTETNYFYADDFKAEFLTIRITQLDAEIKTLEAIVEEGQADENTKERLEAAKQERFEASEQTTAIATYRDLVYKRRPPIPGPCPKVELCFPDVLYFAVSPDAIIYKCTVIDANGGVIAQTEGSPVALDNVDGLLNYVVFMFDKPEYEGAVQIQIQEKLSTSEDVYEFALDSKIGE